MGNNGHKEERLWTADVACWRCVTASLVHSYGRFAVTLPIRLNSR